MTTKEVKDYLMQYRNAVKRAAAATDHIAELRAMAERITPQYGTSGGGSHSTGDKLGAAVARIVDAENRVSDELEMLEATEREVVNTISAVHDATLSTLLYERYINGKTFEQIAVMLDKSWRHTIRLHGAALHEIRLIISKNS